MDDAHDGDLRVRSLVVDHVPLVKHGPQSGFKVIAGRADAWTGAQRLEAMLKRLYEGVGAGLGIGGDEGPDFGQVELGLCGYAEGSDFAFSTVARLASDKIQSTTASLAEFDFRLPG